MNLRANAPQNINDRQQKYRLDAREIKEKQKFY